MYRMLAAIAEFPRDLIVANTREGLAAARARGRTGGRKPKLTAAQVQLAQQLYDAGDKTVAEIASIFTVPRTTIYGHLRAGSADARPRARTLPPSPGPAEATTDSPSASLRETGSHSTHRRAAHRPGTAAATTAGPPAGGNARFPVPHLRKRTRRGPDSLAATPRPRHHLATPRRRHPSRTAALRRLPTRRPAHDPGVRPLR